MFLYSGDVMDVMEPERVPVSEAISHRTLNVGCKIVTIRLLLTCLASTSVFLAALETYTLIQAHHTIEEDPGPPIDTIIRVSDLMNTSSGNSSLHCSDGDSISVPNSNIHISICTTLNQKIRMQRKLIE